MLTEINTRQLKIDPASFRDPSGFIFSRESEILRAIAPRYFDNLSFLVSSKLYESLVSKEMLIPHSLVNSTGILPEKYSAYKVIQPQKIPFISYAYEWCFSQLKRAALLTLKVQKEALKHGMSLKDASSYNIQFIGSKPIFIDTLSFEKYEDGKPWIAYGQFCRHFIAPLALILYKHTGLSKLSQTFMDGIPLDIANALIPIRSLANTVVLSHLHLHSKFQHSYVDSEKVNPKTVVLSKSKFFALIQHMEEGISGFSLKEKKTPWNNYHETHNYTVKGKEEKEKIILSWLDKVKPASVWDLGCNTGEYSLLASQHSNYVLALDNDLACVEKLYTSISAKNVHPILPLVIDLTNPSPGIGWNNQERKTLPARGKADVLFALALIHHLRIGNNTPWENIAKFFSSWGNHVIIEFIPKEDSQLQRMIKDRQEVFGDLDFDSFRIGFEKFFEFIDKQSISDSSRVLCLLKTKE